MLLIDGKPLLGDLQVPLGIGLCSLLELLSYVALGPPGHIVDDRFRDETAAVALGRHPIEYPDGFLGRTMMRLPGSRLSILLALYTPFVCMSKTAVRLAYFWAKTDCSS